MILGRNLGPEDYVAILKRRFWWIIIPLAVVPIAAYLISLAVPNIYTSRSLVLVEQQKVPGDFVRPVITEGVAERLRTMQEQVLSRTRLQPIIEQFDLFKEDAPNATMEQLVIRMRKAVEISLVTSGEHDDISGFTISFSYRDPRIAQEVCSQIESMFIAETLRSRERSAECTTKFLNSQLLDAKKDLDEKDAKLAAFEARYMGQLPGQEQSNFSMLQSLNGQLETINQAIYRIEQDKAYSENILNQQLTAWKQSQTANNPVTLEQQLANMHSQLQNLQSRYTDTHPDVIRAKREIAELEKRIADARAQNDSAPSKPIDTAAEQEPGSIQQLRNQLHNLDVSLTEQQRQQDRVQKQIGAYQARVQLSPDVNQQWKELTRDYKTASGFYDDLLKKSQLSTIATNLEREQQGEQFSVMDPPNLPLTPSSPDRTKYISGGVGGGLLLGIGIALLLEMKDKALRTEGDIQDLLQLRTLALVPDLDHHQRNKETRSLRDKLRRRPTKQKEDFAATRMGA
jgi:polysaccharide chain length determinant protein (PEP-CTERM system associated)